jgi:hypothetical protein
MSSPFQQQFSAKSPLSQDRKIMGEDTFDLVKDENSGNFVAGLAKFGESPDPNYTKDRLVITPEQKSSMKDNIMVSNDGEWIEAFHPMTVKKDSVSGGKTYYGLKNKPKKGTK